MRRQHLYRQETNNLPSLKIVLKELLIRLITYLSLILHFLGLIREYIFNYQYI